MDIHTHLEPRLLRDLDAMSMAHSLEVRPALLDDRVVEFALSMPGAMRGKPKDILLQAAKRFMPADLLEDLKSRPKRTFTFPFPAWLARHLKPAITEAFSTTNLLDGGVLQPAAVQRIWERFQRSPDNVGWSRIWSLFVLTRWCEAMDVHL
jgi:asparagine synthase (glutamine-hydrolysing)